LPVGKADCRRTHVRIHRDLDLRELSRPDCATLLVLEVCRTARIRSCA
jgi:hypothetical protein